MTRLFQFNKNISQKTSSMNASALVVFLLFFLISILAHANHLATEGVNTEQQECYICHQGIDAPPELPQVKYFSVPRYFIKTYEVIIPQFRTDTYVQPQLRAPPVFQ